MPTFRRSFFVDIHEGQIESYSLEEILNERRFMDSDQRWWQESVDDQLDVKMWEKGIKEYAAKDDYEFVSMYEYRIVLLKNEHFYNHCKRNVLNKKLKKIKNV